ncbi:putative legume lectin, alpha chain, concanavalin A-like lectin/glucanase domain superfamily [Helianthus anomalus]
MSINDHVGIDIGSITSVVSRKWFSNVAYGKECRALINYNADFKTLSVSFISFKDHLSVWETGLDYAIDLRHVLPEWVIFGFSASTGNRFEKNNVICWKFNSTEFKHVGRCQNGVEDFQTRHQRVCVRSKTCSLFFCSGPLYGP